MKGRAEKFLDFTSRSGIILSGSKGMISAFYSTPGGYEKMYSQILFRADETKFRDLQGKTRVRLRLCASFFPLLRPFGARILKRAQNSPFSLRRPRGARGKSKKRGFCFFSNFLFTLFSRKGAAKSRELKTTPRARGEAADRRGFPLRRIFGAYKEMNAPHSPFPKEPQVCGKLGALAKSAIFARAEV